VDEPPLAPQPSAAAVPDGQGLPLLIQVMRAGLDARFQQDVTRLRRLPPELREDYFRLSVAVPPERHPFSFETPGEAASRGVELILSRLKAQAETLDLEYVATRTAIKKSYRQARRESVI
jgi:hypothetical protein